MLGPTIPAPCDDYEGQEPFLYGWAAPLYVEAGWPVPLPLPFGQKTPPPAGTTGKTAPYPSRKRLTEWVERYPRGNLAIRLPQDVVGIDVDDHDDYHGADTLRELEAALGPLPATWVSSARELPSGIRFFRMPADTRITKGQAGPWVDIIRHTHRYAVVFPAKHPDGDWYLWHDPTGQVRIGEGAADLPRPDDLPDLPPSWLRYLTATATERPLHVAPIPSSPVAVEGDAERESEVLVMRNFPTNAAAPSPSDGPTIRRQGNGRRPFAPKGRSQGDAYARAAFDAELLILWRTPEGNRNNQLNASAFNVAQLVGAGLLDRDEVVDAFERMAYDIGLGQDEIEQTLIGAMTKGMVAPRQPPANRNRDQ